MEELIFDYAFLSALISKGTSMFLDKFKDKARDKIIDVGVDKLGQKLNPGKTPTEQGQETKAFMDAAFPGTTPWEQNKGGAGSSATGSRAAALDYKREIRKLSIQGQIQKDVAKINKDAVIEKAMLETGQGQLPLAKLNEIVQQLPDRVYKLRQEGNKEYNLARKAYFDGDIAESGAYFADALNLQGASAKNFKEVWLKAQQEGKMQGYSNPLSYLFFGDQGRTITEYNEPYRKHDYKNPLSLEND